MTPHPEVRPQAFLALWNSISSLALQPEYETWHSFEHVPERLGLPGFIEARRYRSHPSLDTDAGHGAPRYFTCYWLASVDALATAAYQEVVAQPTPWSARMRTELRDFLRLPCALSGTCGPSTATQLATAHLRGDATRFAALAAPLLQNAVDQARFVCAHWGTAQQVGQAFPVVNQAPSPTDASDVAHSDIVLMLHGLVRAPLQDQTRALLQALAPVATPASEPAFFELLCQVRQADLSHPLHLRQPAQSHLHHLFHRPHP